MYGPGIFHLIAVCWLTRAVAHASDLLRSDSCQIIPNLVLSISARVYSGYQRAVAPGCVCLTCVWLTLG